ncbi:hypothetical protein N7539_002437 [Penicillium diatomitis]|uniref:Uncharacterized protein n=1 Tax=Penicillium diatomitis TaxID=2819901 RepID=A0A9X0BYN0_9EURO|nr:uncharacterized protein N7539_002437 [Penicillium diatomitis]KAJ5490870.1 hypothetical protein N7539_002437 [Penicillium diatomitis]
MTNPLSWIEMAIQILNICPGFVVEQALIDSAGLDKENGVVSSNISETAVRHAAKFVRSRTLGAVLASAAGSTLHQS